jgi:hypothetical protein
MWNANELALLLVLGIQVRKGTARFERLPMVGLSILAEVGPE